MSDAHRTPERERAVAAYYDRLAPVYGEGAYFRARRAAVLAAIAAEIEGARAVLDLGCGNGTYLAEFRVRTAGARVIGADLSPEMLQAARTRLGAGVGLTRSDATALPFAAGTFDLVLMSHVLQLVADVDRCVAEVGRGLAPGGCLVATVGTGGWRQMVGQLLGPDDARELAALFGSVRLQARPDDEPRVAAACDAAGLQPTWRQARFSVDWPALDEWVRIRWLSVVDDVLRERAERWLEQVRERAAAITLPVTESLLVAFKPSGRAR